MSDPGAVDVVILRRADALRNVGIAVGVIGCVISFLTHGDQRLIWFIGLGGTGLFLWVLGLEGVRRVKGSISAEGVHLGNRILASRRTLRSGWVERSFEGSRVHLDRGVLPDVELEAVDDLEAHTLLRALARDASQTVVRFPTAYRFFGLAWSAGLLGQLCARELLPGIHHPSGDDYLAYIGTCLLWLLLVFVLAPFEMSVGADGVLLGSLVRRRFVPYAEIESAVVESRGKLVMRTRTHGKLVSRLRARAAEAAAELIQSKIACPSSGSESVREHLRRETDRDAGKWLARLRSLAPPIDTPYRAAALATDALWRVVDDPSATGVERAAAAVVLGASATPADRVRLRDAAARIASPRVRTAIQQVTNGANEDELAVALEAIAAQDAQGSAA